MYFQTQFLQQSEVDQLRTWVTNLPREAFFFEQITGRWGVHKVQPLSHRFVNPNNSWFSVSFDSDGKVISEEITKPFADYPESLTLKEITSIALSILAQHKQWRSHTCEMAISIMQHYFLKTGEMTKEIPWHRDASEDTLVILLDDESQWSGGDFFFKNSEGCITQFLPKCGYGIYFSNVGTQHCVKPLIASRDGVNRTILTIHKKNPSNL